MHKVNSAMLTDSSGVWGANNQHTIFVVQVLQFNSNTFQGVD